MVNAKTEMASVFPGEKVKPITGGCKVNLQLIDNEIIQKLATISNVYQVQVKRSGTGMVVVAFDN